MNINFTDSLPNQTTQVPHELFDEKCVDIIQYVVDVRDFTEWKKRIDYITNFPKYYEEFGPPKQPPVVWERKQLEHYLSIKLSNLNSESVVIDIASSNSPVKSILTDFHGIRNAWKQDLKYKTNFENKTLGGDASHIPLEDESADVLMLHNSWEHFEGTSDLDFLCESERILRPGGTVCIIPLNLRSVGWIYTSPSIWDSKYKDISGPPPFPPGIPVVINEEMKQRCARIHDPVILMEYFKLLKKMKPKLIIIKNNRQVDFQKYVLILERI